MISDQSKQIAYVGTPETAIKEQRQARIITGTRRKAAGGGRATASSCCCPRPLTAAAIIIAAKAAVKEKGSRRPQPEKIQNSTLERRGSPFLRCRGSSRIPSGAGSRRGAMCGALSRQAYKAYVQSPVAYHLNEGCDNQNYKTNSDPSDDTPHGFRSDIGASAVNNAVSLEQLAAASVAGLSSLG
ncbi:hypothetical protein PoMZ_13540 [Pyricularia oryzae]|uniref:Uncharacterized protein n=1 Tax=Pyricularia oryzae TaxID=318829 RepID=A0A4V1C8E0_PYROR|nr:hypothetical protein PoMZ_13540 [Pyricularia oryzae]